MGCLMAKMRLGREQQLERYIRRERRVGEELMRFIVIGVYRCAKGFLASLIESVVMVSLSRAIFEEVLGGVGATVDLRDVLDSLLLDS